MGDEEKRNVRRIERQFRWIEALAPAMRAPLSALRARGWGIVRVPIAIFLILGGVFAFLPVLGLWMLPLGLLLLALDLPFLRPWIGGAIIRLRRRGAIWLRWWRRKRAT
ncbi:hypothetical protein AIOL_004224 [Candidatus Rhodobacter oscarellae]|uniref:Tryptophan synthase subunit beta n=1 Tax=Candidatus Rhodobacter oscarellae TaxID=1675527 RepID=A0A0J9H0I0_9RHOB|nr:hypothetical protein [Candidatus Rhodobacter lobularis]KMW59243.1 hypothetical protein AIOL_004224 [Candidatus Rhodobacter lobularis]